MVGSSEGSDAAAGGAVDPLAGLPPPEELFGLPREQLLGREVQLELVEDLLPRLMLRVRVAGRWRHCEVPDRFLTEVSRAEIKVDRGALTRWLSGGRTPFDVTQLEFSVLDGRGSWSLGRSRAPLELGPIADPVADGASPPQAFGVNEAEYSTGEVAMRGAPDGRYYLDLHTADGEVHSIPVPDQFARWSDAELWTDRYRVLRPALLQWLSVDPSASPTAQLWESSTFVEEGRDLLFHHQAVEFLGSVTDAPVAEAPLSAGGAPELGETLLDISSDADRGGRTDVPPPPSAVNAANDESPVTAMPEPRAAREPRPGDDQLLWDGMDPPTAFGIPVLSLRGAVVRYVGAVRGVGRHALGIRLADGSQHQVPVPAQFISSTGYDDESVDIPGLMRWLQIPLYSNRSFNPDSYPGEMPLGQVAPLAYEHPDDNIELNEAMMASAFDDRDRLEFERDRAANAFFSGRMLLAAIVGAIAVGAVLAVLLFGGGSDSDGVPAATDGGQGAAGSADGGAADGSGEGDSSAGGGGGDSGAGGGGADDADAAGGVDAEATVGAALEEGDAPAASLGVASEGSGCAGVGSEAYTTVPAGDQSVPGAVQLRDEFTFAAVDGGLRFCLEIPEGVDLDGAIAGGGYVQSTLTMTLNNDLVEFTVSDGDGVAPFGRIVQRAGAVEQGRFALEAEIVDRAVLIFVPAERTSSGLTFDLGGASYGELSFLGIGVGTFADEVNPIWLATASANVAAFDAAVSWGA